MYSNLYCLTFENRYFTYTGYRLFQLHVVVVRIQIIRYQKDTRGSNSTQMILAMIVFRMNSCTRSTIHLPKH